MKLKDKVALVTGGSRGIGKAISKSLAQQGATVIVNYRSNDWFATETVEEIERQGGTAVTMKADVSSAHAVNQMVEDVISRFGRIDILVSNAGVIRDSLLLMMNDSDFDAVMLTNFGGVYHCTKAVSKTMILQRSGKIINISSIVADRPRRGQSNYASSKGAINAFTRAMAFELGSKGINVNAVAPGLILTDMTKPIYEKAKPYIKDYVALKRPGTAQEVAALVSFLASDDASYISGQVINVDGGMI
jgi:3-oxoacyl-[acyl-carrier protein] reductase